VECLHRCVEGAGLFCVTIAEFRSLMAWEKCVIYFIEYDSRFWHMLAIRTAHLSTFSLSGESLLGFYENKTRSFIDAAT